MSLRANFAPSETLCERNCEPRAWCAATVATCHAASPSDWILTWVTWASGWAITSVTAFVRYDPADAATNDSTTVNRDPASAMTRVRGWFAEGVAPGTAT